MLLRVYNKVTAKGLNVEDISTSSTNVAANNSMCSQKTNKGLVTFENIK